MKEEYISLQKGILKMGDKICPSPAFGYGPYDSVLHAHGSHVESFYGEENIPVGLEFIVIDVDGICTKYVYETGKTIHDIKKVNFGDNAAFAIFGGIVDAEVADQSSAAEASPMDVVWSSSSRTFAYRNGQILCRNWRNKSVWLDDNMQPYKSRFYINMEDMALYVFNNMGRLVAVTVPDGSITIDKLSEEVKEAIRNSSGGGGADTSDLESKLEAFAGQMADKIFMLETHDNSLDSRVDAAVEKAEEAASAAVSALDYASRSQKSASDATQSAASAEAYANTAADKAREAANQAMIATMQTGRVLEALNGFGNVSDPSAVTAEQVIAKVVDNSLRIALLESGVGSNGTIALEKGTYSKAVEKATETNIPFVYLLDDNFDDVHIVKPIYHLGDGVFVDAVGAKVEKRQEESRGELTISFDKNEYIYGEYDNITVTGMLNGEQSDLVRFAPLDMKYNGMLELTDNLDGTAIINVLTDEALRNVSVKAYNKAHVEDEITAVITINDKIILSTTDDNSIEILRVLSDAGLIDNNESLWMSEANNITSFGSAFVNNLAITSFDCLKYFKKITTLPDFFGCSSLETISFDNITTINRHSSNNGCLNGTKVSEIIAPNLTIINQDGLNYSNSSTKPLIKIVAPNLASLGINAINECRIEEMDLTTLESGCPIFAVMRVQYFKNLQSAQDVRIGGADTFAFAPIAEGKIGSNYWTSRATRGTVDCGYNVNSVHASFVQKGYVKNLIVRCHEVCSVVGSFSVSSYYSNIFVDPSLVDEWNAIPTIASSGSYVHVYPIGGDKWEEEFGSTNEWADVEMACGDNSALISDIITTYRSVMQDE